MTEPHAIIQLQQPNRDHFYDQVIANHRGAVDVVMADSRIGKRVAICCAGPSLALNMPVTVDFDEVWAVNSALPYLMEAGVRVTHAATVDQGIQMTADIEFGRCFDVAYLLASSVHPDLVTTLRAAGRHVTFFHNFLGIQPPADWVERPGFNCYEEWLYRKLYPTTVCVGAGLNSGTRVLSVALGMGFSEIVVYGADCACAPDAPPIPDLPGTPAYRTWLEARQMYADGRSPAWWGESEPMAEAVIDGRRWHTRPDLVISAQHFLELQRLEPPGRITFVGDTLVNAFAGKDEAFKDSLPRLDSVLGRVTNMTAMTEILV